tara:strand:+ start:928 stop:1674 length:747 start_codon:yes stop_codon:yes gene_type:complete
MTRVWIFMLMVLCSGSLAAEALRVGVSADYPPLVYRQDGKIVGIEADNIRAVGKIINRDAQIVDMPFKKLIPALRAGEIDVIMSGLSVTEERAELVTFTEPYMEIGQMAIIHRDKVGSFAQPWSIYREGVRIGVEPGTTGAMFAATELPDAQVSFYADADAAFRGLREDQIDLYIHDAPTSWRLATSSEDSDLLSLYSPLTSEYLAWAVRRENGALAVELNRALATMKGNGTLRYILNRWIPVTVEVK